MPVSNVNRNIDSTLAHGKDSAKTGERSVLPASGNEPASDKLDHMTADPATVSPPSRPTFPALSGKSPHWWHLPGSPS